RPSCCVRPRDQLRPHVSRGERRTGPGGAARDLRARRFKRYVKKSARMDVRDLKMLYEVKDLSPNQKLTVESLLGRRVSEDESISVKAIVSPAIVPSK